jgi:hypothetical protein
VPCRNWYKFYSCDIQHIEFLCASCHQHKLRAGTFSFLFLSMQFATEYLWCILWMDECAKLLWWEQDQRDKTHFMKSLLSWRRAHFSRCCCSIDERTVKVCIVSFLYSSYFNIIQLTLLLWNIWSSSLA